MKRPALFLDRDGVINIDHGYVHTIEAFQFVEGIFELVAEANLRGYLVVVVTNQAGIGRGFYTEAAFLELMRWMTNQFANHGASIDAIYFCPFHPEHGLGEYRKHSEFRKPGSGMLLQAAQEHDIDLPRSLILGDKVSDMQAGKAAKVGGLFYLGESPCGDIGTQIQSPRDVLPFLTSVEKV